MNDKNKHNIKEVTGTPNFPEMEKELLNHWYSDGIVKKYLNRNSDSDKKFFFQDGPITANNPMGVHHAWGRTYKDLWQRYKNMRGFKERFQNGFDCQGLWVEVEVEKELGFRSKKDIEVYGVDKFVEQCKARVLKFSGIQTEQSKRLGYFMDWDNSYFTMSDENNYTIWHFLKKCWSKGWIYKGHESVPWCPRCETAISQHEMLTEDYKEITHKSIFLELPIQGRDREFLLVWTTTPWTIPANIAVAVNKDLEYSLVEGTTGDKFWIAKDRLEAIFRGEYKTIIKTVKGSELVGLKYKAPFDSLTIVKQVMDSTASDKFHVVVATDDLLMPISAAEGTGLVHTAVSAGTEDFALGKKLGLPMIPIIADNADYLPGLDFLTGQNAKKHPEIILDYLTQRDQEGEDWVFRIENYTHRYPACWRCKTELVWKIADEWYISMDKVDPDDAQGRTLRQKMIDVAQKINWMPEFGRDRELDWLNNMHDWLISKKNRYWGLALPIWVCDKCNHFEVVGGKEELKEKASAGWDVFDGHTPHRPFVDAVKLKCEKCGEQMSRVSDVGNPWLDAGIVPFSTLHYLTDRKYWEDWFPANFITESFPGQFKNWFYSLIAMSTVLEDTNSFENVLGFASMLGEDGRPMHKSWGNSIEFNEGADKIGVDAMRWTFVRHNPERNLLFGYKVTDEVRRQFLMMLWNSYRFFVNYAALEEWQPVVELKTIPGKLDLWILNRLDETVLTVTQSLENYSAFPAVAALESFVQDLSTWYIRRSRDRIGPTASDSADKEVCYRTLRTIFEVLSRTLAPFIPFMSEMMYTNLTGEESVHLADWPLVTNPDVINHTLIDQMVIVRQICELGHAQRKEKGIAVKQPLSAIVVESAKELGIETDEDLLKLIKEELNVEDISFSLMVQGETRVILDTQQNDRLRAKGEAREIVRSIQQARKDAGCALNEWVDIELPSWPSEFEDTIKQQTLTKSLRKGPEIKIIR